MRSLLLAAIAATTVAATMSVQSTEAEARCYRCGGRHVVVAPRARVRAVAPRRVVVGPRRVVAGPRRVVVVR
jgi:hypothetical protein